MARLLDVAVLNTIQASAADVDVTKGLIGLAPSAADNMEAIPHKDIISWVNTPYAAGTGATLKWEFSGVALVGGIQYSVVITQGGVSKTYSVIQATAWASTAALVLALAAKINLDGNAAVVATQSTTRLVLTQTTATVPTGAISTTNNQGATVYATGAVAYIAPAGTPAEVDAVKAGSSVVAGAYTKHSIVWNKLVSHNAVSGLKVYREVESRIYSDQGATNFTAYEAEMDAKLGVTVGTGATFGIDDTSSATASADIAEYLAR